LKEIKDIQLQSIEKTSQSWEEIQIAIPILPLDKDLGNIFALDPSFRAGGHMVVTNARLVFCPLDSSGIWPWHFAELKELSIQSSLLKSILTVKKAEVEMRWQTLPKGGNAVREAWNFWTTVGKSRFTYPEFEIQINESKKTRECGLCCLPIKIEENLHENKDVRCGACYSLNRLTHPWHGISLFE